MRVGREELDDRAERTLRRENGALVRARLVRETTGVIAVNQFGHAVEIVLKVGDEHRAGQNGVGDGLGNLRFAAA